MSTVPQLPKVAGIEPSIPASPHTVARANDRTATAGSASAPRQVDHVAALQDRLAAWIHDLTTLQDLTGRLARTATLDDALDELLRAGAALVGARRGLVILEPSDGLGPNTTAGIPAS